MIYFVSDLHLGVPDQRSSLEREKRLCSLLEHAAREADEIYILGDLFDFWFEYRNVVPKGFTRLLGTLSRITDTGKKIYLFRGNHDMWMFGYLESECGVSIISDELIIERNGKKFFLHHGDGLGPGDRSYKFMRWFFRSSLCQWLFKRIHPDTGVGLGNYFSRKSRISQKGRYEKYLGDDTEHLYRFCQSLIKTAHYDFMIFGHRHLPLDIQIAENSRYINLGEWVSGNSYAVFDGANVQLREWNG